MEANTIVGNAIILILALACVAGIGSQVWKRYKRRKGQK
jgi:hypothetical protein